MNRYLISIIIFLLALLFLYTLFKILIEMRVIVGVGADGVPRIENFSTNAITGESICSVYSSKPAELNSKCGSLTETNCNTTSCCVWLNGETCVAGNAQGPTFLTKNGKNIDVKTYSTGAS